MSTLSRVRPKKRWMACAKDDMRIKGVSMKMIQDQDYKPIQLRRGVRQGDVILPKLYTAALEDMFKLLDWNGFGININGGYMTHLRFTDDNVVMAETLKDLSTMLQDLNRVS
jgi:hypothetical protein